MPPFRRRHQARGAGATAWLDHGVWSLPNPGHMWLDLQPGDPAALIPQLCASGDYQCSGEPASTQNRVPLWLKKALASRSYWATHAAKCPKRQDGCGLGVPTACPPLRPPDAATGSGPGFELGFAEVADRYHSPLMPNLQRMEGGIP